MKRIRRHIYYVEQLKNVDGELCYVTNPDGSLFSGVYKTKIFPEDLPEWYRLDRFYKRQGYMSTQGIVDLVYIPSQLGTFLKDDVLLVSYVNKIEKLHHDQSFPVYQNYRCYDEEVTGGAILTILAGAKKYSNYNLKPVKKMITKLAFRLQTVHLILQTCVLLTIVAPRFTNATFRFTIKHK